MSIFPLPVFEADVDPHHRSARTDEEIYASLEPPKTVVVKFGAMKLIGEYSYNGDTTPGCGTKLVARTHRGTELVEMLTTTCENAGCNKSVTRQELMEYISNSGGKDFPFYRKGRVLRIATIEDINNQSKLDSAKGAYLKTCREMIGEMKLEMKLVDVEPILGGELVTFYYMAQDRVDFRELVRSLAAEYKARIEMRQVGARDEARLTADYERCGQYCCCKGFLKVLKPVSMKSAKVQKATLDPLKISGRCGRLMCCLRYEDQTYKELRANLPHKQTRVGTSEGPGVVIDTKVLVQLALVRLEHDNREIAVPIEELLDPDECPEPGEADPLRGMPVEEVASKGADGKTPPERRRKRRRRRRKGSKPDATGEAPSSPAAAQAGPDAGRAEEPPARDAEPGAAPRGEGDPPRRRRRRRRRRRGGGGGDAGGSPGGDGPAS